MKWSLSEGHKRAKDLSQRSGGLFALLFDSRIPPLFIIGLILSAVLGNGVYDLVKWLIGDQWIAILIAIGFAILAMIGVVIGAYIVLITTFPVADSYVGLILLMGPNVEPARFAIDYHIRKGKLQYCCLIIPRELHSRLEGEIASLLRHDSDNPSLPLTYRVMFLDDVDDTSQASTTVQTALTDARQITKRAPVIVDITGGTKAMTIGAVLTCREYDVPMEYLRLHRDVYGKPQADVPLDVIFI